MKAVSDTTCLIGLAKGNCFALLEKLFSEIWITTAVRDEVLAGGPRPGAAELTAALGRFVHVRDPALSFLSSVSTSLDEGERTAVALALEIRPDVFLSDDRAARGEANRRGLKWLATVDVIYLLKQYNLIPAVKPVLDTMRRNGFGIKRTLYRTTLRKSGE